ncbi:MAG: aminopeptidase P N-terminal domain-containing protein [Clostridia bacterium]|nr:aminopeptidase P N-terminal domain-containing protein [Clostridia bacterium]
MKAAFHEENRKKLYGMMEPASLLMVFSGEEVRKTNDEYYPFFAERNFVYLTGLACKNAALVAVKSENGRVDERLYILPPDLMAERWTGRRVKPEEARNVSGVDTVLNIDNLFKDIHTLLSGWHYSFRQEPIRSLYLDLYRADPADRDRPAQKMLALAAREYPFLRIRDASQCLRRLRLIKTPEEIAAFRQAEEITRDGILSMMRASRPGMYEYQYKAEFDRALGQYGPDGPGFPSIISAGKNNFCIHYYAYTGQAQEGDMVLNDVGAQWDNHITDVSRGWPCNGHFSEKQKVLYSCALKTSDHMFAAIRPGMKMAEVDAEIRRYNAERLVDAGVMRSADEIGTYMWHGGAHHIGYDVHDVVALPETVAPGMVFCIDVGIYHEEWGIGFRLEDNCLITEDGCENLSGAIPRTIADIEAAMGK